MLKKVLTFILFAISINSVFAFTHYEFKSEVKVGKSPTSLINNNDSSFYVMCLGQDVDFDMTYDDGDEYPSLWLVNYDKSSGTYESSKVFTFDDFTNYIPIRLGIDLQGRILYVPLLSKIISISLDDYSVIDDNISNISANGLEYIAGHLLVSSNDANGNGLLSVINLLNNQVLQSIKIGTNLLNTIYYPGQSGISIASLTVGPYGESSSKVFYGAIDHKFEFSLTDSVLLGDTGNDIIYNNGKLYVTVNFSNLVKEIDVNTHKVRTFEIGTSGYNGPRDIKVIDNKLYVTTYAEDFRIIDLESGALESIINSKNDLHLDGISQIGNNLVAVAGSFKKDYSSSDIVEIYQKSDYISSFNEFKVGQAPLWVANLDGIVNVFCAGNDVNSNGIFDNGDEKPSWWVISNNESFLKAEFEFNSLKYPFIPAIDKVNKLIYIHFKNVIKSYSYSNYSIENDAVANIDANALDIAGGHLLIAKNNSETPDSIYVLNLSNGMVLQKIYGGDEVFDLKYYNDPDGIGLAYTAYNQANNEYVLMYGPIGHQTDFQLENKVVIDKPKNLFFKDNKLITVSTEGNTSTIVDILSDEVNTYNLATYSYKNGPLSAYYNNNMLYATTLNSDYRVFNTSSNELESIYPLDGVGMYINDIGSVDMNLAICALDDKVYIMDKLPVSVEDNIISINNIKVFPNPSSDFLKIECSELADKIDVKIYDLNANLVKSVLVNSDEMISIKDLNSGFYILLIKVNNTYYNLHIRILR